MISFKQFLLELYNVKKFYGANSLKNLFKKLKWREVGSGAHSQVFEIPSKNYVIKVWTLDQSYESFLRYILKSENRNNPHFPRVLGRMKTIPAFHRRSRKDELIKLVKLEKLEPMSEGNETFVDQVIMDVQDEWFVGRVGRRAEKNKDMFPQGPSLRNAMLKMEEGREFGRLDIHVGNFMERPSDGMIVCIDPWHDPDELNVLDEIIVDDQNPALAKYTKPGYLEAA